MIESQRHIAHFNVPIEIISRFGGMNIIDKIEVRIFNIFIGHY